MFIVENSWTYKRTIGTGKRVKHTTNFSIDRIDNNKTYQIGNLGFVAVVVMTENIMQH